MSITAFHAARLIMSEALTGTSLGTLALAAGAIGDAGAWCVLAHRPRQLRRRTHARRQSHWWRAIFTVLTLTVGRKLLRWFSAATERAGHINTRSWPSPSCCSCSRCDTDSIGIHAVFGGSFSDRHASRLLCPRTPRQLEPFAVVFLLPMFFTFSGLNTRSICQQARNAAHRATVIAAACLGKGGAVGLRHGSRRITAPLWQSGRS